MVILDQSQSYAGSELLSLDHTYTGIVPLHEVPYVDFPELKLAEHETTEMPFRYVKDSSGQPIMPKVRLQPREDMAH